MKIETVEATVTSNLPQGKKRQVGVSQRGMAHIMGLLTNLYNDRELAVIREYYTNGLDAHKAAGNTTDAVRVTLPTWDKPNYVVQDFGVGMDEDTLFEIYGEYGESTGRDSNEIVGGFGLGSKSAYSIANQFTVSSIKDGIKTTALFSKEKHGAYDVQIISSVPTSDRNGTTVSIPINVNLSMFNNKAHKFFAFTKPGQVLVDGEKPEYALLGAEKLDNPKDPSMEIYLKPKREGESFVIMGNVPYSLSYNEINLSLERLGVRASLGFVRMPKYFPVPIGSVDISPNREGLQMTDKTNDLIDSYISFIVNDLQEIAKKDMDKADSLEEFFDAHSKWSDIISVPQQFKGEQVPSEINFPEYSRIINKTSWSNASHTETSWVQIKVKAPRIVVTGLDSAHYKKVNQYLTPYMTAKGLDKMTFIITDDKDILTNKWVQMSRNFTFVSHEDIIEVGREQRKKERQAASKANGSAKKSKIRYPVFFVDEAEIRWVDHDEIDSKTPYIQASDLSDYADVAELIKSTYKSNNWDRSVPDEYTEYFELVTDAKEIIFLSNTRTVKALLQRVKESTPLIEEIKTAVPKFQYAITDDLKKYHALNQSYWHRFLINSGIDKMVGDLKDPEIVHMIEPTKKTLDEYAHYQKIKAAVEAFRYPGVLFTVMSIDTSSVKTLDQLDKKYPLISSLNAWSLKPEGVKHIVKYLNMVHEDTLTSVSSKVA